MPPLTSPIPRDHISSRSGVGIALVILTTWMTSNPCHGESWTDLRGKRTIEARMVGMWGDVIVLELGNGRRVSVSVATLRSDSRIQARQIAQRMMEQQARQVAELSKQRMAAAEPAPNPLPKPPQAPKYQAPQPNVKIEDFLASVDEAVRDGHVIALYDSLPPKYRSDLDDVVKLVFANMDNENFVTITSTLQQLGEVIVKKQNWLVSSPRVENSPPESVETIEGPLIDIADTMRVLLEAPLFSLEKLQSTPFGQWLRESDAVLAPYLARIQNGGGLMDSRLIEVTQQDEESASVKFTIGDQETTQAFNRVEGYWVPQAYTTGWDKQMAAMKTKYGSDSSDGVLSMYVSIAKNLADMIEPLKAADDEADFHGVIEESIAPLMLVVEMVAPALTAPAHRSSRSQSRGPDAGREEEEARMRAQEEEMRSQFEGPR